MKVVSNTSPIINLSAIGQLELLNKLFGDILIPNEVYHEISIKGKGQPGSLEVKEHNWIRKHSIDSSANLVRALKLELDSGEAEAIALSLEQKADLLLIDERRGRNTAEYYGLNYIGICGVLLLAKEKTLIKEVKPLLDRLKLEAGFWISKDLYDSILRTSNEL